MMEENEEDDHSPEDTFKILIATDNHLGYAEKDPLRGDDSFITFEEILSFASKPEHNVDFILLGGDLFHDNKPSRYTLFRCADLLKKYTFGDKPIEFEVLIDHEQSSLSAPVNYEDPNLNVSYPVFSIHGNHDDPAGHGSLCSLDLLSAMGLVNHFGKCPNLEQVEIRPVLLQKGCTKLALYGLGAMRDERLHRIFREGKVSMVRPKEFTEDWFNLLVLHQNRAKHSLTSYIPDSFLDEFLDLVIWGHEHECLITPQKSYSKDFYISQPGSSVATSLSVGEATEKSVGILEIYKQHFKMNEIPLKTVRPFVFDDIVLHKTSLSLKGPNISSRVMDYCESVVENLLEKAEEQLSGNERQPRSPLIRVRVEYQNEEETFSINRFGQKFQNRVANPKDIILFHRKRETSEQKDGVTVERDIVKLNEQDLVRFSAVDLVHSFFEQAEEGKRLKLLTVSGLGRAIKEFVDKEEKDAIVELVRHQMEKTEQFLINREVTKDNVDDEIETFRLERLRKAAEEDAEVNVAMEVARQKRRERGPDDSDVDEVLVSDLEDNNEDDFDVSRSASTSKATGRGRGRGRGRSSNLNSTSEPPPSSSRQRGRGARGASSGGRRNTRNGSSTITVQKNVSVATVTNAFEKMRTASRLSSRSKTSRTRANDDDVVILESDEEEPKSKKPKSNSSFSSLRRGVIFDEESDDDKF